ncbi:MAG: glucans biosynthesis glucosyltransferase MdoH [Phenylobacterium sp.]|uniref:glucans biosynthesis glucosyltransferase MdoH n=1 Tax=Phenylobacterium sp. TaxID=1871053 RepID=UPI0039194B9C
MRIMPPRTPLAMPVQDLSAKAPRSAAGARLMAGVAWRRAVLLGTTLALTLVGCAVMARLLGPGGFGPVDAAALGLFAVLFAWVAFAFVSAVAGFVLMWRDAGLEPWRPQPVIFTRTALLLPTYNEDPGRILAAVQAIHEELQAKGVAELYDIFVLSDTRDAAVAEAEVTGVMRLRLRLDAAERIFYRRRPLNLDRKAGNIADWVKAHGGAYESMIILDADSLMGADTIIRLTAAMEREPQTGLIQTLPTIIGAQTLFARVQQFAGRLYGPIIALGQDWWSGAEGNYWGHNAIIRTRAFAACAGLPHVENAGPFSGHIMSHDFVEAALLRRGGWAVRMAAGLGGSYEESPPSLIDMAVRDRRWCQGNLQHSAILGAGGLHWVSRLHLARGVLAYLTAPLWLGFLLLGGLVWAEQARASGAAGHGAAAWLFGATMGLLLAPKVLGALAVARGALARRACGGGARLALGVLAENLASALAAPVMMLMHSRAVFDVLRGRDAGWATQQRDDGRLSLRTAWARHRVHTGLGFAAGAGAWLLDPAFFAWSSPIVLGLVFSIPLSMLSSRGDLGRACREAGLFLTPEETTPPEIAVRAAALRAAYAAEAAHRQEIARLMRAPVPCHVPAVQRTPAYA